MSFIRGKDGQFVRELWPAPLPRRGVAVEQLLKDPWRVMPSEYDQLSSWATLQAPDEGDHHTGPRRHYMLTYLSPPPGRAVVQVKVHVQGFLGSFNVKTLGDWNRSEHHLPRATQHITLIGGNDRAQEAFAVQWHAVRELQSFVSDSLGEQSLAEEVTQGELTFARPVFSRITPVHRPPGIQLTSLDDPSGRARRYANGRKWVVAHRIGVKALTSTGAVIALQPTALRRGDFVDVTFTVNVQYSFNKKFSRSVSHFAVHDVLRLMRYQDVQVILPDIVNIDQLDTPTEAVVGLPPNDEDQVMVPQVAFQGPTDDVPMHITSSSQSATNLPHAMNEMRIAEDATS
ncbi:hypothetical protein CERSUDRAFT_95822 [Gelatoporia subvermispora B]|uniref:Uncharacterized protein n=1 Tax=Ceriporiopsis subvermispora (strain B) TaxID=914234 RepID=M2RCL0_CERS8|nr:hypothetical protein CERSUDRAFT_95822 [Gelatoporia subvermispora B]